MSLKLIILVIYSSFIICCYIILAYSFAALWQSYRTIQLYNMDLFSNYVEKETIKEDFSKRNWTMQEKILKTPANKLNLTSVYIPQNVKGIIIVCQTPEDVEARRQIREGSASKANSEDMKNGTLFVIFLVGTRQNTVSFKIMEESKEFGDIFIADIEESYRNLAYKLMVVYKWISTYFTNAFVVKIDNDTIIDLNQLRKVVSSQTTEKWILGHVVQKARATRDYKNKYYLTREEFPNSILPNYVDGPLYIISPIALREIVAHLENKKAIFLEDVYFTGIVGSNASIPLISDDRIFNKKPFCNETTSEMVGFPAHNSKMGPLEGYKWFMEAKKGNCTKL